MKIYHIVTILTIAICQQAIAGYKNDSIVSRQLDTVTVEAKLQTTSAVVSVYTPTKRQKNSSQTGTELLNRMAIPQLGLIKENAVTTNAGKEVDLFIDFVPASEQDLSGMRMEDVKKVEYYDFPQDPRFLGKAHVINFIMQKYEYGGYVKAFANEFFIANSGQLNLYSKFQYKRMTFDVAAGGWYSSNNHQSMKMVETYRLPQADGTVKVFERISEPLSAKSRRHSVWPTFKATYNSDKVTMVNIIGSSFFSAPKQNSAGRVLYRPQDFADTEYFESQSARTNSVTYSGYWNFILPHGNSISFNPYYSYSHTNRNSTYAETDDKSYCNGAVDNSQRFTASLRYVHDFGKWGNVTAILNGFYQSNKTWYSGTADTFARFTDLRLGPGALYNFKNDKFNVLVGGGCNYDRSRREETTEHFSQPWVDFSIQYSFNSKNSISADFHHSTWPLSASFSNPTVIQSNPLFSYSGNPDLKPYKSYDISVNYVFMPDNRFSFSAFGTGMIISNRYAYVFHPSENGILRTVQQKGMGNYSSWAYGISASARLLNNSLIINGDISHRIVHNGKPFNWTRQRVQWYLQASYYTGGWNFGMQYSPQQEYCDGYVSGEWIKERSSFSAVIGWGCSSWSVQGRITNPFRWNWKDSRLTYSSSYYDVVKTNYGIGSHCYVQVSATYTFGYGKKINRGNEATQQQGAASGILTQ